MIAVNYFSNDNKYLSLNYKIEGITIIYEVFEINFILDNSNSLLWWLSNLFIIKPSDPLLAY